MVALVGVLSLWTRQVPQPNLSGLARTQEFEVSTSVSGRLQEILVEQYDLVQTGQLIASLDMAPHQAALETAKAELARLSADVAAQQAALQAESQKEALRLSARREEALASATADKPSDLRRFLADESGLEIDALKIELKIAEDRLEANRLEVKLKRAESLASASAGPESDIVDFGLRREQALERAKNNQFVLQSMQAEIALAKQRRQAFELKQFALPEVEALNLDFELQLQGLRSRIVVQRRILRELELAEASYLLHAPRAGRISTLPAPVGQALLAGEPVVVIMDPRPREALVYVAEGSPSTISIGDSFNVSKADAMKDSTIAGLSVEAVVHTQVPNIQQLPARLWKNPLVAEYGKIFLVGPLDELELIPGERIFLEPLP
jgi:multidrug resistance efflux pump